jgi:hypothetical protein
MKTRKGQRHKQTDDGAKPINKTIHNATNGPINLPALIRQTKKDNKNKKLKNGTKNHC